MITTQQRESRRNFIGSSDAAAIMGLDPYRSAADVWLSKTAKIVDFEGNEATERGTFLEPSIIAWAESKLGVPLDRDVMLVHPSGVLAANLDARYAPGRFIVEAKSTVVSEEWGPPGTDEVPNRVLIQGHHQLAVAGDDYDRLYVPVLMASFRAFKFQMYEVPRNKDLVDLVAEHCTEFWEKYVKTDTRPDDFKPSLETLKRMNRVPAKSVPVSDELVDALIVAKAAAKQAEEEAEQAQAAVLAAMGDAEGGSYSRGLVTYMETRRKAYTVQESSYRTLRIKANKVTNAPRIAAETAGV